MAASAFALVVVAHCDDADYYCGGTIARWSSEGHRIVLAVLTDGARGTSDVATRSHLVETRRAEQARAAQVLGITATEFLRYPDGELEPTRDLQRDIVRLIRQYRPDTVVTLDPRADSVPPGGINHPDHCAAGRATLAAVYPAAHLPTYFPELENEGLTPHHPAEVLLAATDAADEFVDIGATIERKIVALREHASQFGDGDGVAAEVRFIAEWTGRTRDLAAAEGFRRLVNSW